MVALKERLGNINSLSSNTLMLRKKPLKPVADSTYQEMKSRIHHKLLDMIDLSLIDTIDEAQLLRETLPLIIRKLLQREERWTKSLKMQRGELKRQRLRLQN